MVKYVNKFLVYASVSLISGYQLLLSPLLGSRCRFYPTCSSYAKDALLTFGFLKGLILIVKRLGKCHPFHPGGIDMIERSHSC